VHYSAKQKQAKADFKDSNDNRPARATADVTDTNDDASDTTFEGTDTNLPGQRKLHP